MAASPIMYISTILICMIITESYTIYLPEGSNSDINQLDTIEKHQQQNYLNHLKQNTTTATQHHKSYDKNDDVVALQYLEAEQVEEESVANALHTHTHGQRQRRELSDWLIAPNTRWCGRGNTANGTYNHLGGSSSADKCCRKHDHCQLYIPAMSNRYEVFNYRPYTLSHCNCDRRFRTCLKMAHDEDASTIGTLFFNIVQMQCFILRTEKLCQKRADDGHCEHEQVRQKAHLKTNKKF